MRRRAAFVLTLALLAAPAAATAPKLQGVQGPDLAALCLAAADAAAEAEGIPPAVLRALTRTETGRSRGGKLQPWPWTVNMEGAGHWFDSRAEALAYVEREQARGARSFDVGCFQINHRWHGQHFASVDAMFDPAVNAAYAARFVRELYDETGDWSRAAGYFHSRTPQFYERYRSRFDRLLAAAEGEVGTVAASAAPRKPKTRLRDVASELAATTDIGPGLAATAAVAWAETESAAHAPGGVAIRLLHGRTGARIALIAPDGRGPLLAAPARPLFEPRP